MGTHYLTPLFAPAAIAVFGCAEQPDALAAQVLAQIKAGGYAGPVYAISPQQETLGPAIDLALIATPPAEVAAALRACARLGARIALVLAAHLNPQAIASLDEARRSGLRVLGPDSLGLLRPAIKLNASPSHSPARRGPLALVSQSGAICAAILDWAAGHALGFSCVVSTGKACDIGIGELLDYLASDAETRAILVYLEGVGDVRRFLSGLRAAARLKPVVVVKAGRHEPGQRAAAAHTGAAACADDVFDAALARAGAVRAGTVGQLFAAARVLSTPYRADGDRLAIVTNAGGPGVMAADWAVEKGVELAALSGPLDNPLDLQAEATAEDYRAAVAACLADDNVDGVLAMLAPQALAQPTATAEALAETANPRRKPLLACWLGGTQVREAREIFDRRQIPGFANPESAVAAFGFLAAYRRNQQQLLQAPGPLPELKAPDVAGARLVIEGALAEQRGALNFLETRAVLRAFDFPLLPAIIARSPNEALAAAECLGFPVAMKILSPDIRHKSAVGGVRLNIPSAESVRLHYAELTAQVRALRPNAAIEGVSIEPMRGLPQGRELSAGIFQDPAFGPALRVGAGGAAANSQPARAVALPPLNEALAQAMLARLPGPLADRGVLAQAMLRLSALACELPQIAGLDIDPLCVDADGAWALDAHIAVREPPPCRRPYGHMAIHPYPSHLARRIQLADGSDITLRPIRPEDAAIEQDFVRQLSAQAKYFRFMDTLRELSPAELIRLTQLDYARDLALIATRRQDGGEVQIGVARYFSEPDGHSAEFALAVADAWQQRGIGAKLMGQLIDAAREQGLKRLYGEVLAGNVKMLRLAGKLGFARHSKPDEPGIVEVEKQL